MKRYIDEGLALAMLTGAVLVLGAAAVFAVYSIARVVLP